MNSIEPALWELDKVVEVKSGAVSVVVVCTIDRAFNGAWWNESKGMDKTVHWGEWEIEFEVDCDFSCGYEKTLSWNNICLEMKNLPIQDMHLYFLAIKT